jgi:hypothetical protein
VTKQEFAVFIATINTAYPKCDLITPVQTALWYDLLGHIDFEIAKLTLKKYILNNKFPPTIAELNSIATDLTAEHIPDSDEDSLSETVRKTVERIGFQIICQSQLDQLNTLRAQFKSFYEAEYRRSMEIYKMPESMRLEQTAIKQAALPMKEG